MKDFWEWAANHYLLTFILAWVVLATAGNVLTSFFGIFHRTRLNMTDEQFDKLLEKLPDKIAQQVTNGTPRSTGKAPTWYDRLQ